MKIHAVRVKMTSCPACHVAVDGAGIIEGHAGPKPDDLCICVYCFALNQYDSEMQLRSFDYEALEPEDRQKIDAARASIRAHVSN